MRVVWLGYRRGNPKEFFEIASPQVIFSQSRKKNHHFMFYAILNTGFIN